MSTRAKEAVAGCCTVISPQAGRATVKIPRGGAIRSEAINAVDRGCPPVRCGGPQPLHARAGPSSPALTLYTVNRFLLSSNRFDNGCANIFFVVKRISISCGRSSIKICKDNPFGFQIQLLSSTKGCTTFDKTCVLGAT